MNENGKTSEILHHLGEDDFSYGAVSPPIFQSSIFCYKSFETFQDALTDEGENYIYTRGNNPTVNLLEEKLARLEHAQRAKLVSSGVAAISLAVLSQVSSGDHIIAVEDSYSWSKYLFHTYLKRFNITVTFVEGVDSDDFLQAIRPNTKVIYLESPTTFTFKLQNLQEVAKIAKSHGIKTIIDNTWASPLYQKPIDHGIDIVVHSASKYLGGNSDLVGGVILGAKDDLEHIFKQEFLCLGPVPDPMAAWLILRNIRTLHIRMPVHYQNAKNITAYLQSHNKVESVLYPFLSDYPQFDLAKQQMTGGGGLFSFRLKTRNLDDVKRFTTTLHYFKRAVSWGGYESLVCPSAVTYKKGEPIPDERISLIRCYAGLEDSELLISDLDQALATIQ